MLKNELVEVDGQIVMGVQVELPNAPMVMLIGRRGFLACGYFKLDVADRFDHALAVVSGVRSFQDLLEGKVTAASQAAQRLGVTPQMTGAEAIKRMA